MGASGAPEVQRRVLGLGGLGDADEACPPHFGNEVSGASLPAAGEGAAFKEGVVLHRVGDDGGQKDGLLDAEVVRRHTEVVPGGLSNAVEVGPPLNNVEVNLEQA